MQDFSLAPNDYVRFVERFVEAGVPVRALAFQGYEVTLPGSWPYLDAVFRFSRRHAIRCSFITNGMLLHKWASEIAELAPRRVSISLDGAEPAVHDPLRGISGAFDTTIASIERFLRAAPAMRPRLAVASSLYDEGNFRSLLALPPVLEKLGIRQWMVVGGAAVEDRQQVLSVSASQLSEWFQQLSEVAASSGLRFYISDEFGQFRDASGDTPGLQLRHVFDLRFFYRVYPAGYVRVGREFLESWDTGRYRRWDPSIDDPLDVVDYWAHAESEPEPELAT